MKRRLRTAGLVMLAAAAALVIFWESGGRERFMYERIPVMASDVTRGTVITGSMITLTSSASWQYSWIVPAARPSRAAASAGVTAAPR